MDRGAWRGAVHRVARSWIRLKRLGTRTYTHTRYKVKMQGGKIDQIKGTEDVCVEGM